MVLRSILSDYNLIIIINDAKPPTCANAHALIDHSLVQAIDRL